MQKNNLAHPLYIVGAGSFAVKLAYVLKQFCLDFQFVDEITSGTILNVPILRACDVNTNGRFLIAISFAKYSDEAIERLTFQGVSCTQCLPFLYDSDARVFSNMLEQNTALVLNLLKQKLSTFAVFDANFHVDREETLAELSNQGNLIAFCAIGEGGGYIKHLGNLPARFDHSGNCIVLSDSPSNLLNVCEKHFLMGQSSMLQNQSYDLVIASHVYPCSPPSTKKLSLSHMVYDFLLFDEQTYAHLSQADTHYIVVPSSANMKMHQEICIKQQLSNNIVLIPGGYPRHDQNLLEYQEIQTENIECDCILYAPTLSSLPAGNESDECFSINAAVDFIPNLIKKFPDKTVIFRPHPEDLALAKFDLEHPRAKSFIALLKWCEQHPQCEVDTDQNNYLASFSRTKVLITDTSSVGFSFGLITGRPVLFYSPDHIQLKHNYASSQFVEDRQQFGVLVSDLNQLHDNVQLAFSEDYVELTNKKFCQSVIYNPGASEDYIQDSVHYILNDIKHPDWWYLQDHLKGTNHANR